MKGYVWLFVISLAVIVLVPFCAFPRGEGGGIPPAGDTVPDSDRTATFSVKNDGTGEVLTLSERDFLVGVVSCEMSASSPHEALKAQAVAAYTYYCKQRTAAADGIFSNVPDAFFTHGTTDGMKTRWGDAYERNYTAVCKAVDAVKGETVVYDGAPITACYHAISAGLTERAADVWGGDYPYLVPVDSAGDLSADGYETTVTLEREKLAALLKAANADFSPTDTSADWFGEFDTTDSGFVRTVTVCGTVFKGTAVRAALSLRSACFTVNYTDDTFTFTVRGYGHNVGMSQAGAVYMANNGATYREILSHYYPGTTMT